MNKYPPLFRFVGLVWVVLSALTVAAAEEAIRTPSDQMKEAVNKLGRTPTAIKKSLGDLTDRLREAPGGKANGDSKAEPADLNLPTKTPQRQVTPANTRSRPIRDPFRPMTLRTNIDNRPRENLSPLERLELSQIKLVGIVWDIKEPRAMVEDTAGLGYVLKVGTPIGSNGGKVKAIHQNEVVVEESFSDVTGGRKVQDAILRLPTE